MEVEPAGGVAFDTDFKITLTNYTTDFETGLDFVLYGAPAGDTDNEDKYFRIMTSYKPLDMVTNVTEITMKLPELGALIVRMRDINGETVDFKK